MKKKYIRTYIIIFQVSREYSPLLWASSWFNTQSMRVCFQYCNNIIWDIRSRSPNRMILHVIIPYGRSRYSRWHRGVILNIRPAKYTHAHPIASNQSRVFWVPVHIKSARFEWMTFDLFRDTVKVISFTLRPGTNPNYI